MAQGGHIWEKAQRRKLGIRARLTLLAVIAIVPLVIDRARDIGTDRAERIQAASEQALRLARQGMATQNEAIVSARTLLQVIATAYPVDTSDGSKRGDCIRLLAKTLQQAPWLKVLSVVNANGRIFCSTYARAIGLDVSQHAHMVQALATGEFVVSDYFVAQRISPTIVTVLPRHSAEGSIDGFLTALIDLSWFERVAREIAVQSGSVALMVDGTGALIARYPHREDWTGRQHKDHPLVRAALAGEEGVYTGECLDGIRRIFGFVQLPGTSSRFLIGLEESEILRRVNREMWLSVAGLGGLTAFLLIAIWLGGERLLVAPIRALTQAAQRFGRGEFGARASTGTWAAEFVPLATALDDMAKQLAAREQDLHDSNSQLQELAKLDGLTGLINRRTFNARLADAWSAAQRLQEPLALILLDVDHFKRFNDRYGHSKGDSCLRKIAEVLKLNARTGLPPAAGAAMPPSFRRTASRNSDVAARYGGEEFALLLPGASLELATKVAERLRQSVENLGLPHDDAPTEHVTISLGVAASVPADSDGAQELIDAADAALYAAKRRGRNAVVTHEPMRLPLVS